MKKRHRSILNHHLMVKMQTSSITLCNGSVLQLSSSSGVPVVYLRLGPSRIQVIPRDRTSVFTFWVSCVTRVEQSPAIPPQWRKAAVPAEDSRGFSSDVIGRVQRTRASIPKPAAANISLISAHRFLTINVINTPITNPPMCAQMATPPPPRIPIPIPPTPSRN